MVEKHTMPIGDVARAVGLSTDRVRELDADLKPIRGQAGHRRYDPAVVSAFAEKRLAKRAA